MRGLDPRIHDEVAANTFRPCPHGLPGSSPAMTVSRLDVDLVAVDGYRNLQDIGHAVGVAVAIRVS